MRGTNCNAPPAPWPSPERRHVRNTLRLWGTVFVANVLGALVFAALAVRTSALEPKIMDEMVKAGLLMVAPAGRAVFWSGVVAGWNNPGGLDGFRQPMDNRPNCRGLVVDVRGRPRGSARAKRTQSVRGRSESRRRAA